MCAFFIGEEFIRVNGIVLKPQGSYSGRRRRVNGSRSVDSQRLQQEGGLPSGEVRERFSSIPTEFHMVPRNNNLTERDKKVLRELNRLKRRRRREFLF